MKSWIYIDKRAKPVCRGGMIKSSRTTANWKKKLLQQKVDGQSVPEMGLCLGHRTLDMLNCVPQKRCQPALLLEADAGPTPS